jgi:hypothetical protein
LVLDVSKRLVEDELVILIAAEPIGINLEG